MQLLILTALLIAGVLSAPMQQSLSVNDDGSYQFYYETGEDAGRHSRSEIRHPDGTVIGKYSYEDANGDIREVSYRADDSGYVANGDVSVEGAPKGQFPADPENQYEPKVAPSAAEEGHDTEIPEQTPAPEQDPQHEEPKDEDNKAEEDMKVLALEESSANDPPEGFPLGYFLQSFHGLRRLPEPTKEEDQTATTSKPRTTGEDKKDLKGHHQQDKKEDLKGHQQDKKEDVDAGQDRNQGPEASEDVSKNEMDMFMNLRPFQNSFGPQQIGSSMFRHQPVYVFSYQHPDSFGYHYYF